MDPKRRTHGTRILWALICLAAAYCGLLRYFGAFTGQPLLDGGLGVVLGLYTRPPMPWIYSSSIPGRCTT